MVHIIGAPKGSPVMPVGLTGPKGMNKMCLWGVGNKRTNQAAIVYAFEGRQAIATVAKETGAHPEDLGLMNHLPRDAHENMSKDPAYMQLVKVSGVF